MASSLFSLAECSAGAVAGPGGAGGPPTGSVVAWLTAAPPTGYLLCDGTAVSRTAYNALFLVIGTTFGVGDNSTTFALPNLKGRFPVGLDSAQTEFDTLGETGGAKTVTLDVTMMPAHTHVQDAHNHTQDPHTHVQNAHSHGMAEGTTDGSGTFMDRSNAAAATTATTDAATAVNQNATATNQAATATNQATGGGLPHANLPPYLVVNYVIKA